MEMTLRNVLFPIVLLLFSLNGLACASDKEGEVVLEMEGGYCSKYHFCKLPLYCDLGGFGGYEEVGTCSLPKSTGDACTAAKPCPKSTKCIDGYCRVELGIGANCRDLQRTACAKGLLCKGSLRERSCEGGLDAGYRCDGVHRYCKSGLDCRQYEGVNRCITKLKENDTCGKTLSMCGDGLECVQLKGKRQCRKEVSEGLLCDLKKDIICGAGQACTRGKCHKLRGVYQPCIKPLDQCTLGTKCTDTKDVRRCLPLKPMDSCPETKKPAATAKPVATAKPAATKPATTAKPAATAKSPPKPASTKKPDSEPAATAKPAPTTKPTSKPAATTKPAPTTKPTTKPSVTDKAIKTAVPKITVKPTATKKPAATAAPKTTAKSAATKKPAATKPALTIADVSMVTAVPTATATAAPPKVPTRGELCNVAADNCAKDHVCLGAPGSAKCHLVQRGWGECKGDHALCIPGWHCRGPVGSRLCLLASKKGKRCDHAYFKCENGLTCMKWGGQPLCVEFKSLGASCESEFDVCDTGLSCDKTSKKCVKTVTDPKVKLTQSITQTCNSTNSCTSGNVCVGPSSSSTCLGWLGSEANCENRDYVCGGGTGCRGNRGRKQLCKKLVPRGKGCDNEYYFCEQGLTCMIWGTSLRCVAFRGENEDCTGAQTLCTAGTKCTTVSEGKRTCLTAAAIAALPKPTQTLKTASVNTGGSTTAKSGSSYTTSTITYSNGTVVTTTTYSNGTVTTSSSDSKTLSVASVTVSASPSASVSPSGSVLPSPQTVFTAIAIPISVITAVPVPAAAAVTNPSASASPTPSTSVKPSIKAVTVACPDGCPSGNYCLNGKCVTYVYHGAACNQVDKRCHFRLTCKTPSANATATTKICEQINDRGKGCGGAHLICQEGLECISWGTAKRCVKYIESGGNCHYTFDLCRTGFHCRQKAGDEFRKCYAV